MSSSSTTSSSANATKPNKAKQPQQVFDTIFAFPPNRDTLGGTAYLVLEKDDAGQPANILVDCPALNEVNQAFIAGHGGVNTLFVTHRGGMAQVDAWQAALACQVLIQEQEAYLLPTVSTVTFHREHRLSEHTHVFWSVGHSPGSACLYHSAYGGVLFTGRHLLPTKGGAPSPLRLSKTFHWPRQLQAAQRLLTQFSADTLSTICPGASTGFLRGEKKITNAYRQLQAVDWASLAVAKPGL